MTPEAAARLLWEAARKGWPWPDTLRGALDADQAYGVQLAGLAIKVRSGNRHSGWRAGWAAAAGRTAATRVCGHLVDDGEHGGGATLALGQTARPHLEPDVCVTLARPLAGPGVTPEQAWEALGAVAPALGLVSLRGDPAADPLLHVADNLGHWGYVLGPDVGAAALGGVLRETRVTLHRDGGPVALAPAAGGAPYAPLEALAWLANFLASFRMELEAGQRILTGALAQPLAVAAGQSWEARFAGLGAVAVRFA
jgi:2-oxo-hept-3-ene-1,7-dioate hydratase